MYSVNEKLLKKIFVDIPTGLKNIASIAQSGLNVSCAVSPFWCGNFLKRGGVNKRDTDPFIYTHHFNENGQWHTYFSLKFYKAVIRYSTRKIFPHTLLNVEDVEIF